MADRFAHSNQVMRPRDMSDRKVKLQAPVHFLEQKLHGPVYQKPSPQSRAFGASRMRECRLTNGTLAFCIT